MMLTNTGNAAYRDAGDEAELVEKIKARDVEALEELYDLYSPLLFGVILSIVKKREAAEQLLEDVFIKVWNEAESFNEKRDNVFSWMVALARKKAFERTRSSKSTSMIESDHHDPLATTIFSDRSELVKRALDNIPENQSEILKTAYSRGLTQSQISKTLGTQIGTVKTQIQEGMFALNRILSEYITTDG